MPRVKRGVTAHRRHKKILKMAKGYRNIRRTSYRRALEAVMKAGLHAYRNRREKKRDMRSLWIIRINAAIVQHGLSYSRFIHLLASKGIIMNRKMLSELAATQPMTFEKIVNFVK